MKVRTVPRLWLHTTAVAVLHLTSNKSRLGSLSRLGAGRRVLMEGAEGGIRGEFNEISKEHLTKPLFNEITGTVDIVCT